MAHIDFFTTYFYRKLTLKKNIIIIASEEGVLYETVALRNAGNGQTVPANTSEEKPGTSGFSGDPGNDEAGGGSF